MATAVGARTYEDLCRAREGGTRYELIEGALVVVAGPSPQHQGLSGDLYSALKDVVQRPGLGRVYFAPLDVRLSPGTVVQPDVIVILNARRHIIADALIDGAPDLVVEVTSPSSRARDLREKARLYARFGVREYWLVDTDTRTITVQARPAGDRFELIAQAADVARSVILPELTVDVAALFAGLAP